MLHKYSAIPLLLAIPLCDSTASAAIYYSSAQRCRPQYGRSGNIKYDYRGVFHDGTSPEVSQVQCGLDYVSTSLDVAYALLYFVDNNPSMDSATVQGTVTCELLVESASSAYASGFKVSCSTIGGCAAPANNTYVGSNNYLWWPNPINGGVAVTAWSVAFYCAVPQKYNNTVSVVNSYELEF